MIKIPIEHAPGALIAAIGHEVTVGRRGGGDIKECGFSVIGTLKRSNDPAEFYVFGVGGSCEVTFRFNHIQKILKCPVSPRMEIHLC